MKEARTELAEAREAAAGDTAKISSLTAQNKLLQTKLDALQAEVQLLTPFPGLIVRICFYNVNSWRRGQMRNEKTSDKGHRGDKRLSAGFKEG